MEWFRSLSGHEKYCILEHLDVAVAQVIINEYFLLDVDIVEDYKCLTSGFIVISTKQKKKCTREEENEGRGNGILLPTPRRRTTWYSPDPTSFSVLTCLRFVKLYWIVNIKSFQ